MRWVVAGMILLTVLIVVVAVVVASGGKERRRPPRIRGTQAPSSLVIELRA